MAEEPVTHSLTTQPANGSHIDQPASTHAIQDARLIWCMFFGLTALIGPFGNTLTILTTVLFKHMRRISHVLLVNIECMDLIASTWNTYIILVSTLAQSRLGIWHVSNKIETTP